MIHCIHFTTILSICYLIVSCTPPNEPVSSTTTGKDASVIEVDMEQNIVAQMDLLSIVDTILPLETTENNLIGHIWKIRQYFNNYYLLDVQSRKIQVFSTAGQYKYELGREGKGPGEMVFPGDFFIDRSRNAVVVSDVRTGKTSYYDSLGNITGEIPLDEKPVNFTNGISNFAGQTWVLNQNWQANELGYLVLLDPATLQIISSSIFPEIEFYRATTNPLFLTFNGTNAYLSLAYDNAIYEMTTDSVMRKYFIDFGEYNITEEEKNRDQYMFVEILHRSDRATEIINFIRWDNGILYFAFNVGTEKYHYFYDERSQHGMGTKNLVISGIPVDISGYGENYELIGQISTIPESIRGVPVEAVSEREENILKKIQNVDFQSSNPVLVKFGSIEGLLAK